MNKDNTAISKNRQKKEHIVAEVKAKMQKAQGLVFTNYQGLTHQQIEHLKKDLRKADAEYAVIKNTLIKRTLVDRELTEADLNHFQQPTGTLFMYSDVVEPLKALAKTMKLLGFPTIKFGILDGTITSESDVIKLSTLPSKDVLRAQLLGMMKSPILGLHRALSWNMQKILMTLSAIADKKS